MTDSQREQVARALRGCVYGPQCPTEDWNSPLVRKFWKQTFTKFESRLNRLGFKIVQSWSPKFK